MKGVRAPRFKICCIAGVEEARLAVDAGASAIGLVSAMPSGPGPIEEEAIAEVAQSVPPGVATFLLTCLRSAEEIIAQQRRCGTNTIQICDRLEIGTHREIRRALPGIAVVQVIHVTGPESVEEAIAVAPHVHGLLLDSGNQSLAVKELGGTGRIHDWAISRRIRDLVQVPIFLAGGLNPANVGQAIRSVQPYAVDVCSGLRTDGRLDPQKVGRFIKAIAAAGRA